METLIAIDPGVEHLKVSISLGTCVMPLWNTGEDSGREKTHHPFDPGHLHGVRDEVLVLQN